MDSQNVGLATSLVSRSYVNLGAQALQARHKAVRSLLSQRRLPATGWDEATIEAFLQDVAMMDSNNFPGNVGVGEREARVACPLVARRHFRMAHGIGRSGDIAAEQPKAAGSSLLARLTNLLALDALRVAGLADLGRVTVLPMATGMAMTLTLLAIKAQHRQSAEARYVIWPRIDQKTCLKAITAAGLEPVVIPMLQSQDELVTDVAAIQQRIKSLGSSAVVAVVTTTSCFAPRASDSIVEVASACKLLGVPHVINNAYGVQSAALCCQITTAWRRGRVDAVVQSTDKNFMVPVGGAIVASPASDPSTVEMVNRSYPGRACMAPLLDLLMTLLHWGVQGWRQVLQEREELHAYAYAALQEFAVQHGERRLDTPGNPISMAMTVSVPGASDPGNAGQAPDVTVLGSMLFNRWASGARVISRDKSSTVAGIRFTGYGAHSDGYPHDYLTLAAALGTSKADIDNFLRKLSRVMAKVRKPPAPQADDDPDSSQLIG